MNKKAIAVGVVSGLAIADVVTKGEVHRDLLALAGTAVDTVKGFVSGGCDCEECECDVVDVMAE